MQTVFELLQALRVELSRHRILATFVGCLVLLGVLAAGYFMPSSYYTDTVLYVDQSNILEPLLEGQAEVQQVNQVEEVKEKIYTRRILESVAIQAGLLKEDASPAEVAKVLKELRGGAAGYEIGLQVQNRGNNYIGISYSHTDADVSYKVIDAVVAEFINDIAETKRSESRRAFDFIDGQVKAYKKQLQSADDRLKEFRTVNKDGTTESVNRRIEQLRRETEELRLEINEQRARRSSLTAQLENESEFLNVRSKTNVYRERIREAQAEIDNLLLTYTETYPDVVALRLQIEDHKNAISQIESRERSAGGTVGDDASLNLSLLNISEPK
ncbi:hypothetical protein GYB62_00750 [bacterium]|nr:hypothetical protein [bacterium]